VFVVDDAGKVAARPVETGTRQHGRVAIESGLSEGVSVVVAGAGFLNDGNLVRIATAEAAAADTGNAAEPAQ
jgi:multidrug efflux pump subunit AcrA (membrane-fusion protein)